jgi:alkylation response protein AidB-like acyl-CoA dehydrogenase
MIEDPQFGVALEASFCRSVASDSLGAARAILSQTIEYLKGRQQFGRPVGSFQALKHRAADMAARLAVMEHLVAQGAQSFGPDAAMWSFVAKSETCDAFNDIAADCIRLHGGVGFTWEYDAHLFLKRAHLNGVLAGTNAELRDQAAAQLAAAVRSQRSTVELRVG